MLVKESIIDGTLDDSFKQCKDTCSIHVLSACLFYLLYKAATATPHLIPTAHNVLLLRTSGIKASRRTKMAVKSYGNTGW